jgi:hypothetical protein
VTIRAVDVANIFSGVIVILFAQRMQHLHTGRLRLFTYLTEFGVVVLWQEINFMAPRQPNPESSIRSVT